MKDLEEKTITKEKIYCGKVINLEVHEVLLPDKTKSTREILKHNGAVAILALTKKNEVLFVQQYRKAIEQVTLEIPAGKIDKDEEREKAAIRELKEETGYSIKREDLKKICDTHVALGYSSEMITIYFVKDLEIESKEELSLDDDEFLNLKKIEINQVFNKLDNNKFTDSKTIIALQWLRGQMNGHI